MMNNPFHGSNKKRNLIIALSVAGIVITAYALVVGPSLVYSAFSGSRTSGVSDMIYKVWTDEKIVRDSDVIVMGDALRYESNRWIVGGNTFILLKGDTQRQTVIVNSPSAESTPMIDKPVKPQEGKPYIWFLAKSSENEKENKYGYASSMDESIVDVQYFGAMLDFLAQPTIVNKVENQKGVVNLFDPTLPKADGGQVDYYKLIQTISKPLFEKMFAQKNITVNQDDIFLMTGVWFGMYTDYSSVCGYAIDEKDKQVYWLESELRQDTLTKAVIMTENPMPCKPNFGSCFCDAQIHLAKNTVDKLVYFDEEQEAHVGKILQEHLAVEKVTNVPKKFVVGNHNFEMASSDITFCGAFASELIEDPDPDKVIRNGVTAHSRYLEGVIKNDEVVDFSLLQEKDLCAINKDAKVYPFEHVGED